MKTSFNALIGSLILVAFVLPATAQELIAGGSTVKMEGADSEKKIRIAGRIAGPFSERQAPDDERKPYKAFHVQVGKPMNITGDDVHCGEQEVTSLAISHYGMKPYLGKTVMVTATLSCHPRLGRFHLTDVIVKPL